MTSIELNTGKVLSGIAKLPASEQDGLTKTVRFLFAVFGPRKNPDPTVALGLQEIEQGVVGLVKSIGPSLFSRSSLEKKIGLIVKAAELRDAAFTEKLRGALRG